jgi:hypothetical protein
MGHGSRDLRLVRLRSNRYYRSHVYEAIQTVHFILFPSAEPPYFHVREKTGHRQARGDLGFEGVFQFHSCITSMMVATMLWDVIGGVILAARHVTALTERSIININELRKYHPHVAAANYMANFMQACHSKSLEVESCPKLVLSIAPISGGSLRPIMPLRNLQVSDRGLIDITALHSDDNTRWQVSRLYSDAFVSHKQPSLAEKLHLGSGDFSNAYFGELAMFCVCNAADLPAEYSFLGFEIVHQFAQWLTGALRYMAGVEVNKLPMLRGASGKMRERDLATMHEASAADSGNQRLAVYFKDSGRWSAFRHIQVLHLPYLVFLAVYFKAVSMASIQTYASATSIPCEHALVFIRG